MCWHKQLLAIKHDFVLLDLFAAGFVLRESDLPGCRHSIEKNCFKSVGFVTAETGFAVQCTELEKFGGGECGRKLMFWYLDC
ncbi:MAG: hypothetical protein KKB51_25080 [Candidatus Riflebacteria bacterium]|nr:hypothetical protein [Candidatus Riflebacteria bacterium]